MEPNPEAMIEAEEEMYLNERAQRGITKRTSTRQGERAASVIANLHPPAHMDEETPLLDDAARDTGTTAGEEDEEDWPGRDDFKGLPWWKTPSVYWLLPFFLIWALAVGGTLLPKTNLIMNFMCRDYFQDLAASDPSLVLIPIDFGGGKNEQCDIPGVDKRSTRFTLMSTLISAILSAMTSPKLGALSDRYGRKAIIAAVTLGMLFSEIITIVAATYPETFNINWLLLGYVMDGLTGSFITGMAISHSYATDCTSPRRRNVAFGYFHGCLFAGIGLGPVLFGLIVKKTHSLLSIFYLGLACHAVFLVCLAFVIPESLSKRRQMAAREKHAVLESEAVGPQGTFLKRLARRFVGFFAPLKILYPTGPGSSPALRRNLIILAAIDTITFGVAMGAMSIVIIYVKSTFHWDVPEQSVYMSTVNLVRVSCLILVLPALTRLVRGPATKRKSSALSGCDALDLGVIRFAIVLDIIGFIGYTLARSGSVFILAGCVAAIGGIGAPALQSSLTKHVPIDRTGELLGTSGLLHSLSRVVAPIVFSSIFYKTADHFRQTVFLCLTVTFSLAAILSWFVRPHVQFDESAFGNRPESDEDDASS